jgi:glycosyltransferase involved in cell wall biosynthesis
MKIVRIIARLNVGGPARHVVWLTAGLRGDDCQSVLVAGTVPAGEDDMSYFAAENGVAPIYIQEMSREISWRDSISVWKIYRLLVRERPDIVHTHTAKAGTVGRTAALLYRWLTPSVLVGRPRRLKVVHTYHGHIFHSYYGSLKTRLFLLIERTLARFTDRIVVVSEQQRNEINDTFRVGREDQFAVIPLGLELRQFASWRERRQTFREELGAKPDEVFVGIVGRLTEIKNHELFFEAVRIFKEKYAKELLQTVRFVVIGDGALRSSLAAKVHSAGLDRDVIFVGNRTDPENFYPALDVVALTSRNEGTPLTLIEAMANARPVIATAVGGVVDLLGEVTADGGAGGYLLCQRGIRVSPGDAAGFAAGLKRLIDDELLRRQLGDRGQQFVEHGYSKDRLLNDIRSLYDQLIQLEPANMKVPAPKPRVESRV